MKRFSSLGHHRETSREFNSVKRSLVRVGFERDFFYRLVSANTSPNRGVSGMRFQLTLIEYADIAVLVAFVGLIYGVKEGFINYDLARMIGLPLVAFLLLRWVIRFVKYIKEHGNESVGKVFNFEKQDTAAELRRWAQEAAEADKDMKRLPLDVRNKIETLEASYIKETSSKTTLSLAQAYDECGLSNIAKLYYDQLLQDFKWSKEARSIREVRRRDPKKQTNI